MSTTKELEILVGAAFMYLVKQSTVMDLVLLQKELRMSPDDSSYLSVVMNELKKRHLADNATTGSKGE